ncbi:MAG: septum formation initiator family protein [Acidobacteriota bacterium]|nr:septum formation initiator family protein [Acidobacteriota bacterium]MDQ5870994.1 septum formation initiator family protein [Acidobacteriota bacterium]
MTVRNPGKPVREPRPLRTFFLSLAVSALLLGALLSTDRRVLELRKAKVEVKELDRKIKDERKENARLTSAIDAANREEFPAEKVAREELNLVHPEDLVLLYPPGSLSGERKATPTPTRHSRKSPTAPR